jgi:hypothetical protein
MEIEMHHVRCQHPFGEGIHVLIPPMDDGGLISITLLESLRVAKAVHTDYLRLKTLVTPEHGAVTCRLYQGTSPRPEIGTCYAVVTLRVNPDETVDYTVVILLVDPGWEEEGKSVAEIMRAEMVTHFKNK